MFSPNQPSALKRDIKSAFRVWRANPGSTFAAYFGLALGIGATTAIFSVASSALISPLPFADADRVVRIASLDRDNGPRSFSLPDALDLKKELQSGTFAFYRDTNGNLAGTESDRSRAAVVHVLEIDPDLFKVMGLKLSQGAPISAEANHMGAGCESVISWQLWKTRFFSSQMSGRSIRLNEKPCRVDGVLPEHLDLPVDTDVWIAKQIDLSSPANQRGIGMFYGLARLNPTDTLPRFNAVLSALSARIDHQNPVEAGLHLEATPIRKWLNTKIESTLLILFAAVLAVSLMTCFNVANLLLARASARMREMSIRVAVGATRGVLLRQLLTESFLLAFLASLSGLALSFLLIHWLKTLPATNIPRPDAITVDWRVVCFALCSAVVTALVFGAFPALKVSLTSLTSVLGQATPRVTESRRQQIARKVLIAVELAVATVLLVSSLLLLRSFHELSKVNLGFQPDHLLTGYISINPVRYRFINDYLLFSRKVVERLDHMPGIQSATFCTNIPLQAGTSGSGPVQIEGQPLSARLMETPFVIATGVSPSYRETLRIPIPRWR